MKHRSLLLLVVSFCTGVLCLACGMTAGDDLGTIEEYCEARSCPVDRDAAVARTEERCEPGSFDQVEVLGCGYSELRPLSSYSYGSLWFDTESGELVGMTHLSDVEPEHNGTFVGSQRPDDCDDERISECTVCGWSSCEWEACGAVQEACGWSFPCLSLWECARDTGCRGDECLDEETCPGFSMQFADSGIDRLLELLECVESSGCSTSCPNSWKLP